jgi:hypothetical protein
MPVLVTPEIENLGSLIPYNFVCAQQPRISKLSMLNETRFQPSCPPDICRAHIVCIYTTSFRQLSFILHMIVMYK